MLRELICAQLPSGVHSFLMLRLQLKGFSDRLLRKFVVADVSRFTGFEHVGAGQSVVVHVVFGIALELRLEETDALVSRVRWKWLGSGLSRKKLARERE